MLARWAGFTYVFQVLHHIEEQLSLLIIIAALLDGLPHNQILGDFGPHVPRLRQRCRRRRWHAGSNSDAPVRDLLDVDIPLAFFVVDLDTQPVSLVTRRRVLAFRNDRRVGGRGRRGRGHQSTLARALRDKFGFASTVVPLPRNLGRTSSHAVHPNLLGARRNIDQSPVLGSAAPCLTELASRIDPTSNPIRLVLIVRGRRVGPRPLWLGGRAPPLMLDVDLQFVAARRDDDLVLMVVITTRRRRPGPLARDRAGACRGARPGFGDVDLRVVPSGVDVYICFSLLDSAGCGRRRRRRRR